RVVAGRVVVPVDVDHAVGLIPQAHRVRAVGAVDRHTAAAGDETHDLVAGHRRAATRQAHHHVVDALDIYAGIGAPPAGLTRRPGDGGGQLFLAPAQFALNPLRAGL